MKTNTPKHPEAAPVRILKICSCRSLSGDSTLVYHVGCKDRDIQLRVYANDGGGFFSNEWVPLTAVQQALDKNPGQRHITSIVLFPLFKGKSANTPAFLFAALKHAGLVERSTEKPRSYERVDSKGFISEVKALIASSVDLKETDKPQKSEGKTPAKKTPSKSSKKKTAQRS